MPLPDRHLVETLQGLLLGDPKRILCKAWPKSLNFAAFYALASRGYLDLEEGLNEVDFNTCSVYLSRI